MRKIKPVPGTGGMSMLQDITENDLETARAFNEKYLHYDQLKFRTETEGDADRIWAVMKLTRRLNEKKLNIGGIPCRYTVTSDLPETLFLLEKRLSGFFEHRGRESGESYMRYHSVASFMEEAISSSILEGAAVARKDAKRMIRKGIEPVTRGQKMIMNNYIAMENIKKIKDSPLTQELIMRMHETIVRGTLAGGEKWEGGFREDNETVVGDPYDEKKVYHRPPDFRDIPKMVNGLCEFANSDTEFMHPIVKAVILHYMIGYIHPFADGNGRLARSLFYWYSVKNGYWIMEYAAISNEIKSSASDYGTAYQYAETDGNDLTYFIRYNLKCITQALDSLEKYIKRKANEKKDSVRSAKDLDLNTRQATVLKDYADGDAFSIMELKERYGTAYQTMRLDVLDLLERGFVHVAGKDGKKIFYAAAGPKKW